MSYANDTDRAADALKSIPADCGREEWHAIGRSAIAAGLSVDDIDTWSATAGKPIYEGTKAVRSAFKGITPGGGTSEKTLFKKAFESGWVDLDKSDKPAPPRPARAAPERADPKPAEPPSPNVALVWARCQPATAEHGYIARKSISDDFLPLVRVVPQDDPLTQYRGWLAAPGYIGNVMTMLEFVPPGAGDKLTIKGGKKSGASLTVGIDGGSVYVGESIGVASANYTATGCRATACFGAGNIKNVVMALRRQEPDTEIIITPDRGKEGDAHKIATEFGCKVVCLPECEQGNFDVNDLMLRDGLDVLQELLKSATEPPKPPPLLKPVSVFDLFTNPSPPPEFVWDGYLPRGQVTLFGAHGGTGKSTIGLMLAVAAVLGRPLFGVDTDPCKVLFVSLEDGANIVRHRLAGICRAWLIDPALLRNRLHVVDGTEHPELFTAETRGEGDVSSTYAEMRALVKAENIGLILIDNASDAFGGDEIQRRQVRAFMRSLALVARLTDCAVVLLAHVDKSTSRAGKAAGSEAYSGSTAWHNSARSRLFLTRGEDGLLTLEHQKSNLGRMREPLTLEWLEGGFPQVVAATVFDTDGVSQRQQGRADDDKAISLLKLIAEFEGRGQYCSPAPTARNTVFHMLKSEPYFQALKLNSDATKRIVTQCQRAKWIDTLDYKSAHTRKYCQRWALTTEGYAFAGVSAPTAPTAPTCHESAMGEEGANVVHPLHPHMQGVWGNSAHTEQGAEEGKNA